MKLVYIKPGSFMMGPPTGETNRNDDGGPQHRVTITKGFYMGAYEVTQEQYEKVMGANPSRRKKGSKYPVDCVTWIEAAEFCRKLLEREDKRYRLPTEAEWEYACRAGSTTRFSFGDSYSDLHRHGNHADRRSGLPLSDKQHDDGYRSTAPVGSLRTNVWGLYDMHGNVSEWCQDWYAKDYYGRSPETDPQGPDSGDSRVLRGGSWRDNPAFCRSADRTAASPTLRTNSIGFRVVLVSPRSSE